VRGFITTPLERSIAAADGIDYLESRARRASRSSRPASSSTTTRTRRWRRSAPRSTRSATTCPPEAQVPVLNISRPTASSPRAYLSFTSEFLQQNEITDYLVRVVQPRLSAIAGVQRADILGARTFAMRIWLKPDRMAALNVSPSQVRAAWRRTTT
jgi:multidrug efflux pump